MTRSPRVFISYAHEAATIPGHRERALELTQSLRARGIETEIDQFHENKPGFDWPRWMVDEVRAADFVLCIASPLYRDRVEARTPLIGGLGARWEGSFITHELYSRAASRESKFLAVLFDGSSVDEIPDVLQPIGRTHYRLPEDDDILYRTLTDQPRVTPAPLGPMIVLT